MNTKHEQTPTWDDLDNALQAIAELLDTVEPTTNKVAGPDEVSDTHAMGHGNYRRLATYEE